MHAKKLRRFSIFITAVVWVGAVCASPVMIYNAKNNTYSTVTLILENAERESVSEGWDNPLSLAIQPEIGSDNNIIIWDTTTTPFLQFNLNQKNFSIYRSISLVAHSSQAYPKSGLRLTLKEKSGEIWEQQDISSLTSRSKKIEWNFSEDKIVLADGSPVINNRLDLKEIVAVELIVESPGVGEKVMFDNFGLFDMTRSKYVNRRAVDPIDNSETGDGMQSFSLGSSALGTAADTTGPSISNVKVGGKELVFGDLISHLPLFTADLSDTESGIATWSMSVINSTTSSSVQTNSGHGSLVTASAVAATWQLTSGLEQASYVIQIDALNGDGVLSQFRTTTFNVEESFAIKNAIVGPNPVNLNNDNVDIEYQLTADSQMTILLYSISGEEQWASHIGSGSSQGGSAGFNRVSWNGINKFGEQLSNGPYIIYLIAKRGNHTKRVKLKLLVMK